MEMTTRHGHKQLRATKLTTGVTPPGARCRTSRDTESTLRSARTNYHHGMHQQRGHTRSSK
eukprot:5782547-Pleurochrysis_carterae.AAC.1